MGDVTRILNRIRHGDDESAADLLGIVYDELRQLAKQRIAREKPGQTLQPTALVHEAFIRLVRGDGAEAWDNRAHFFGAAAEAMRRILVEAARRKARLKHGGGREQVPLSDGDTIAAPPPAELLALHEALDRFAQAHPVHAKLVELRFFGGLAVADAGAVVGISRATADRYWAYARAWLYDAISDDRD